MSDYKNIPVDTETHNWLLELCQAYEMSKRSQGAMVRKLVKAEHEKLEKAGLLPKGDDQGTKNELAKGE